MIQPSKTDADRAGHYKQNTEFDAWTILNEQGDIWTRHIFDHPDAAERYKAGKGIDKHTIAPVFVQLSIIQPPSTTDAGNGDGGGS